VGQDKENSLIVLCIVTLVFKKKSFKIVYETAILIGI